jgi:hypothetical protein
MCVIIIWKHTFKKIIKGLQKIIILDDVLLEHYFYVHLKLELEFIGFFLLRETP